MPESASRKAWTRVAFGDSVKLSGERSSHPEEDGFERFVGLEHIDPGDLKIRRWGAIENGTTFTSVFRPGQVLFGKRRAYQRKVAIADFSGVCSGDIYVLEPKNAHLLPELLPFICQTEGFFKHAVGTSAGSLSPRTNWDSLARYELALPPIEEQRRIAAVLGSFENLHERLTELESRTADLIDSAARSNTLRLVGEGEPVVCLEDVGDVTTGRTPKESQPECWGDAVPFVTPGDMDFVEPALRLTERGLSVFGATQAKVSPAGSILVVCIGSTIGKVARCMVPVAFNQQINAVAPRVVDSGYLFMCLLDCGRQLAAKRATTAVPIVNKSEFSRIRIPMPSLKRQIEISKYFTELLQASVNCRLRKTRLSEVKHSLLETALGAR